MVWYKIRKDRLVSDDNIHYIGYGINAYSGLKKVKVIKDITLNKKTLARQIKMWNHYRISLEHLEDVIEDFMDFESSVSKESEKEEKPYSLI